MPLATGVALAGLGILAWAISLAAAGLASWGYDFAAYYAAAERLLASGNPYQAETLRGPFRPGPEGLYLYAPVTALFFVPFTFLAQQDATLVWLVLRLVLLAVTSWLLPVAASMRLLLFGVAAASQPLLHDLNLGNVSLVVSFLAVVIWRARDHRLASVALVGSIALRPTMAVIGAWWLLRREWRLVVWAIAAGVALVVLSLPMIGVAGWADYLTVLRNLTGLTGVPENADLGSAVLFLGGSSSVAQLALYAGYAIAALAIVLSLRRDRELSFVVTVTATLLLSPLLWDHYLTLLIVPAAFLISRGHLWGVALPMLGWLPLPYPPFVALLAVWLPFVAPPPSVAAASGAPGPQHRSNVGAGIGAL